MKRRLLLFGSLGLFWMVFFTISRILFLTYHHELTATLSWTDIFIVLALGTRMDAAIAADAIILTGLLLTISCIRNWRFIAIANHCIVALFLLITSVIVTADFELYRHW